LPSLKTAAVRALRREYSRRFAKAPPQDVIALALRLMDRPGFESRFIAHELIGHHRAAFTSRRAKELAQFGRGLDRWEAVDTVACYLSGPAWRESQVSDALIHRWARSKDHWRRRTALVSTVPLNNPARGGRGDADRTLTVCRMLINDRDDRVVKALSWALRELAKREPRAVRQFVAEHESALAPRVKREVQNKLKTGLKNPRGKTGR